MENINFETIYIVIEVISLWNDRQKYAQLLLQILFVVGLNLLFARRLSTYALCSIKNIQVGFKNHLYISHISLGSASISCFK